MKNTILKPIYLLALIATAFIACKKDVLEPPAPPKSNNNPKPIDEVQTIDIKIQAVVTIGAITYDSIPAELRVTSWDSNNVPHQKNMLLDAGVNVVPLPKSHTRFEFSINKWGISDALSINRQDLQQDVVYTLGGRKSAKMLSREETYLYVGDEYQPSSKIYYNYDNDRISAIDFYQKKPQSRELQFTRKHLFHYSFDNIGRIEVVDPNNTITGFTDFTYNQQGTQITHMHQKSYDVETYAAVEWSSLFGAAEINITYLYNNGHALEYKMTIQRGNKVADGAMSSTGAGEGGSYKYDFNINPFAHMKMPDLYLSNLSKNNLVEQQKNYSGSIPSVAVYKYEYTYDNDGYPAELVKYYKGYMTGEHLYKTKTVFTYL